VYWADACGGDAGWLTLDEVEDDGEVLVQSVGFLVPVGDAGSKENLSFGLLYRKQWIQIEDAPTTFSFSETTSGVPPLLDIFFTCSGIFFDNKTCFFKSISEFVIPFNLSNSFLILKADFFNFNCPI
jgi:hypothetical protein